MKETLENIEKHGIDVLENHDISLPEVRHSIKLEDKRDIQDRIYELKEEIELHSEKIKAKQNSEAAYPGVNFSATVGGIESTDDLVKQKQKELDDLRELLKYGKAKKPGIGSKIRQFLLSL